MYEFPKTKKLALRDVNEIQKYFDELKQRFPQQPRYQWNYY